MKQENKNITWNLTHLFSSDTDPKLKKEEVKFTNDFNAFAVKWREDKAYLTEIKALKTALEEYEMLFLDHDDIGKVAMYWILRSVQNQSDELVKSKKAEAIDVALKVMNAVSFFELELAKVPSEQQEIFLNSKELAPYKHHLEQLFESAKYLLSEKEEQLILSKSQPANDKWVEMVSEFLAQESKSIINDEGKKVRLGFDELISLLATKAKKEVRDTAAKYVSNIQKKLAPIATYEINSILLNKKIDDELRGFQRPDSSRHLEDDLDAATVDALVTTVTNNFTLSNRYYRLRAALFGKKQLEYHEKMIPFGEVDKTYSYEDAVNIVGEVFEELDPEFKILFDSFIEQGLIDPFPHKGKDGGGACYSAMATMPPFIYMNFVGKLRDLTTLAHECGHAMHFVLSKKQNALNQGHSKATAEVASTFMEEFVLTKLSENLDDKSKLILLISQLDGQISSIFRQIALYNFETELHTQFRKKMNLSQEEIGKLFVKHMSAYTGDALRFDKNIEYWWVYWSHIRLFFYVYSYASGHLISSAMQNKVKTDKSFIEKVKVFLSSGQSKSPRDIFLEMGIDIADKKFWEDGLREIEGQLNEAEALAKKLGYVK